MRPRRGALGAAGLDVSGLDVLGINVVLVLAAAALGCGTPGRSVSARPSLLEPTRALERQVSPAEWRYHPRQATSLARSYDLGNAGRLFVGALGERWLVDGAGRRAEPAPMLAPEPLVGALAARRATWVFVGQSGTTYESESPLGPFLSRNAPSERLARADAGSENVLGISGNGQLLLSEDAGLSWHLVGPSGARFSDVLLAPPHALALAVPERLWWSETEGRQWRALDVEPFGADRLILDEEGPVVGSVLGARAVRPEAPDQLRTLDRAARPVEPELNAPLRAGPSARALGSGRALLTGEHYFEVTLGVRTESLSGAPFGELERRALPALSSCQEIQIAGYADWVYVACTRERTGATRRFEFFRSEDRGRSFAREEYVARGNPEQVHLAVGRGGALLLTGLCLPSEMLAGCHPQGIQERQEVAEDAGAPSAGLRAVPTPALEESALALTFSADGLTAYAVAQRTKSDALFVFISTELETGFTARPLPQLTQVDGAGASQVQALTAARDGQVSLVLARASAPSRLVILDREARPVSVNSAPVETASIGAYGTRALAVSPDEAWESLDGGAQWTSVGRLPRPMCSASVGRCTVPIQCSNGGCAIGDNLSRVGWRGQSQHGAGFSPTLSARPVAPNPAVGTAWSCELSESEWRELIGVTRLPDASQAAIGRAAWFALSTDDATAAAGLWIAEAGAAVEEHVQVRHIDLLPPSERAGETAYHASLQIEGAAALRYKLPGTPGASPTDLQHVEVAWENLLRGRHDRGVIPNAGAYLPGDYVKGDGMARRAQPDLLSIADAGVYVRVHRQPEHDQVSYYLNGKTVEEVPKLSWMSKAPKGASSEMARVGGQDLPLLFVNQGATVVRARRQDDEWRFDAMSVGFAHLESFSIRQSRDIAYLGERASIHLTTERAHGPSEAYLFPLQADGPVFGAPLAVPTQADLNDASLRCTPAQRTSSPRLVAPQHPGSRRPVLIHDPVEPLRLLLTDSAVLHGTPDQACVEVFDADVVKPETAPSSTRERALVSVSGPSWLFRVSPENTRRDLRIEYRRMQCKPDPGLEIPPETYQMPATGSGD